MLNLAKEISKKYILIRYLLAGGTGATINIAVLYVLTDVFGIWYLFSSVVAFIIAFVFSFTLHKFWAFESKEMDRMGRQMFLYFVVVICNLLLNTIFLYFLVETVGLWYLLAQVITGGGLAVVSFFIYKHIVFKPLQVESNNVVEEIDENII